MAAQETNHHDATPRIACALPLVDFDWKLKYTVASATIAAVNKSLLRLELYVSKASSRVEEVGLGTTVYPENQIQPFVAEFSKAQLDALLGTMDAIEQASAHLVAVILILKGRTWGDDLLEEHCSKLSRASRSGQLNRCCKVVVHAKCKEDRGFASRIVVKNMGQEYKDSAKAAAEADRIASIAGQNLQQVLLSLRNCLHVVHKTKRMLEVDPDCICVKSNDRESKWERRRRELHEAADSIEFALEYRLRNFLDGIETSPVDTDGMLERHNCPEKVGDDNSLWCDRVYFHEKVDMDSALWCITPQTILDLVFARLPLHQIFRLRCLSKPWRASIMSPSFQNTFGTISSRRFAINAGKRLWSFGTSERKWYALPFEFPSIDCDSPVAGDGGLLCCRRPALPSISNQVKQDLQLYVCNPLTQA